MPTQVAPLGLRLFLEGVEVPVIAAQVSASPSQPASASIQIVPTDLALGLLPRTLVHLFYLGDELTEEDVALANQRNDGEARRAHAFDVLDDRYKILFTGEVIGLNYNKSSFDRSMVLQCMDLSSYWDTCYQWFADYSVQGDALFDRTHVFVGAGAGLFNNVAGGTSWVLANLIQSPPANPAYKNAKGLLGGFIHLLESIGGVRPRALVGPGTGGKKYTAFRGVNDFFTIAELRYNLSGQIGAVADDTTSQKLYAMKAFFSWLKSGMSSLGSLISFRDVVRHVSSWIFHDVYPNPVARYVGVAPSQTKIEESLVFTETDSGKAARTAIEEALGFLDTAASSYDFPVLGTQVDYRSGLQRVNRAGVKLNEAAELLEKAGTPDTAIVMEKLTIAKADLQQIAATAGPVETWTTGEVVEVVGDDPARRVQVIRGAIDLLKDILDGAGTRRKKIEVEIPGGASAGDHFYTQLIFPETFFISPPKCNVIFPDQYMNLTYSRNFMREVSRLSLQAGFGIFGGSGPAARILGHYYAAPNIADMRNKVLKSALSFNPRTLMPHEIHSGIIPKFEWVSAGHRWGIDAAIAQGKGEIKDRRIGYLQRLANFHFFLNRWAARSMSLMMRFNPMLVLGLPVVVLDRSAPSSAVITAVSKIVGTDQGILPTAFVGKLATFTHNVSQGGGTTEIAVIQCRTHRGLDDEFLGVLARERVSVEGDKVVVVVEDLLGGASSGELIDFPVEREILSRFVSGTLERSRLPSYGKVKTVERSERTIILTPADQRLLGLVPSPILAAPSAVDLGVDPTATEAESDVTVPIEITVKFEANVKDGNYVIPDDLPSPEKLLFPGWYSSVWYTENVGEKVYRPLLGCQAITDDEEINSDAAMVSLLKLLFRSEANADMLPPDIEVSQRTGAAEVSVDGVITRVGIGRGDIEKAIDGLTLFYGVLKRRGLDTQSYIRQFTKRPVATLPEILGTSDLQYTQPASVGPNLPGTVAKGVEGFHSRAFGDYNADVKFLSRSENVDENNPPSPMAEPGVGAMENLFPKDAENDFQKNMFSADPQGVIPLHLDPRGRARQRVRAYAEELRISRGLLGT